MPLHIPAIEAMVDVHSELEYHLASLKHQEPGFPEPGFPPLLASLKLLVLDFPFLFRLTLSVNGLFRPRDVTQQVKLPLGLGCHPGFQQTFHFLLAFPKPLELEFLFLLAFPKLKELKLTDILWEQQHHLPHIFGKKRSKNFCLQELTANAARRPGYLTPFMTWLKSTPSADTLENLSLRLHGEVGYGGVRSFLQGGAKNLKKLSFNVLPGILTGMPCKLNSPTVNADIDHKSRST